MISPQKWNLKRPGLLIPVFFLSLIPMSAQLPWPEASIAAIGGCFAARSGYTNARYNQAGLGRINKNSISLQHSLPFIINGLGISSVSGQIQVGEGAFGAAFTTFGIRGLSTSSAWISYGMKLHPGITAGIGIHLWNHSIPERVIFNPGFSCALGIQARVNEKLVIGGHVLHPFYWTANEQSQQAQFMVISAGCSYTFFQSTTFLSDLHIMPDRKIQLCYGLALDIRESIKILFGMHNMPVAISGGIETVHLHWTIHISFEYLIDSGSTPSTSLSYAW